MFQSILSFTFLAFLLVSCGNNSEEMVTLNVLTPIGMKKNFHQLSDEVLPSLNMYPSVCKQNNLMLGWRNPQNGVVNGKRISLQLSWPNAGYPLTNASDILATATLLEPLTLTVAKGKAIDIGILGAVYDPIDSLTIDSTDTETANTSDGVCDSLASTGSTAGRQSYSIHGTKDNIVPGDASNVSLNVGVATAIPAAFATPTPPSNPGSFVCPITFTDIHQCTIKDYISYNTSVPVNKAEVQYLFNTENGPAIIRHQIKNASYLNSIVPRFFPMNIVVGATLYNIPESTASGTTFSGGGGIVTITKY